MITTIEDSFLLGQVFPPRYTYERTTETSQNETQLARKIFYETFEESKAGKFVARAVSRSLQGNWKLDRQIISHSSSYPSGSLTGMAKFLPRLSTADDATIMEYLYLEEGNFSTDNGLNFTAKRRYGILCLPNNSIHSDKVVIVTFIDTMKRPINLPRGLSKMINLWTISSTN